MGDGPHPKRVPRLCGGGPQTNLDPRFELDSMGGIRIGSVIDQKGFGRPLEGFLLNYSQNYFCFAAQLRRIKGAHTNQGARIISPLLRTIKALHNNRDSGSNIDM